MRSTWLVGLLAAVACGEVKARDGDAGVDAPDPNDGLTSGTRLKLEWLDFGGAKSFRSIFDSQLNTDCSFQQWMDGELHCTPSNAAYIVYANATCTQKMAQVYRQPACANAQVADYVRESIDTACGSTLTHLYQRGTALATTQYWQLNTADGSCQGPFDQPDYDYYALGAEVPPSMLATGTVTKAATPGRLAATYFTSADGLRAANQVHDNQLDVDCYPQQVTIDKTVGTCVPIDSAYGAYYADATCSQRVAERPAACGAPTYAVTYGQCPYEPPVYYTVGAQASVSALYYQSDTCQQVGFNPMSSFYTLGTPIDLPMTARGPATTGSRIEPIRMTTPEGLSTRDYQLYDTQLGAECYPSTFPDGTSLCIPFGANAQPTYSDPACTVEAPIATVYRGRDTCAPSPLPKYAVHYAQVNQCTSSVETRLIGAPHTGAVYLKDAGSGTCFELNTQNQSVYDVGPVITQDQLATGTKVVDP